MRGPRWSAADMETLRLNWGEMPLAALAAKLGRSAWAVYRHAEESGLPMGPPKGREYVTQAAARAGFHHVTFRRVLRAAGVQTVEAPSQPSPAETRRQTVDSFDADRAVEEWNATENIEQAAKRRGLYPDTLRRKLRAAGAMASRKDRWHRRVPTEVIERVLAESPIRKYARGAEGRAA